MSTLLLAKAGEQALSLNLKYANRHGLIAGATGTGKTVTLQRLAQGFAENGVNVFMADIKGDLSGISQPGTANPKVAERVQKLALNDFAFAACPTVFWDVFAASGHPVRTTISEMGPLLLGQMLELSEAQEGVLAIAFAVADDQGLLLLDLKDLRSMLQFLADNSKELQSTYGQISDQTVGTIQRKLLQLEQQGAEKFFGEPALDINDLLTPASNGKGMVHLLAADKLMQSPRLYATFLLWLLSELFETLPEVGDMEKPKLVFFFDEAHLLFNDAPKALLEKVEQVVRLIRSKGVGVYFITQNPQDIPETVLGQLGNRVQHALRAFTPKDQKAVKVAAETFRPNPAFKTEDAITELGVGEALVSLLEDGGVPGIVQRAFIAPPASRLGPVTAGERMGAMASSPVSGKYDHAVDRASAFEILKTRAEAAQQPQAAPAATNGGATLPNRYSNAPQQRPATTPRQRQGIAEAMAKSAVRSVGNQVGRALVRGLMGALLKR